MARRRLRPLTVVFSTKEAALQQQRQQHRQQRKGLSLVALFMGGLVVYTVSSIIISSLHLPHFYHDTLLDLSYSSTSSSSSLSSLNGTKTAARTAASPFHNTVNRVASTTTTSDEQRDYWKRLLEKERAAFPSNPLRKQQQHQGPDVTSRNQWYPGRHVIYHNQNGNNQSIKTDKQGLDLLFGGRPPLSSLINETHILVDPAVDATTTIHNNNNNTQHNNPHYNVSWLLDFAIVGFGKCGTSSVLYWLSQQPHVAAFSTEVWDLMNHKPRNMVDYLYRDLPFETNYWKRGYKGPSDISQSHVISYFRDYFDQTKLIIGLRHPIRFFESLYNFRIQNYIPQGTTNNQSETASAAAATAMPHPNHLIGRCTAGMQNACTEKSNYAYYLLRLGKTTTKTSSTSSRLAEEIVGYYKAAWYNLSQVPYTPNPVFLYHMEQLNRPALARDLLDYLNLSSSSNSSSSTTGSNTATSIMNASSSGTMLHARPGKEWAGQIQERKNAQKIDICQDEYKPVRRDLLRMGRLSAQWIEQEFLKSPDVHCSELETQFLPLLQSWGRDPCSNTTEIIAPVGDFMLGHNSHGRIPVHFTSTVDKK